MTNFPNPQHQSPRIINVNKSSYFGEIHNINAYLNDHLPPTTFKNSVENKNESAIMVSNISSPQRIVHKRFKTLSPKKDMKQSTESLVRVAFIHI